MTFQKFPHRWCATVAIWIFVLSYLSPWQATPSGNGSAVPHTTAVPQTIAKPLVVFAPQTTADPHTTAVPLTITLLPHTTAVPHTIAFCHTEPGGLITETVL